MQLNCAYNMLKEIFYNLWNFFLSMIVKLQNRLIQCILFVIKITGKFTSNKKYKAQDKIHFLYLIYNNFEFENSKI